MAKEIRMTPKELSKYGVISELIDGYVNGTEAAKQIGLSIRQVKRLKAKVIKEGQIGIIHKSRGKESNRRISEEKTEKMKKIVGENYRDFGPKFASEKLEEIHKIKVGKEKLRLLMTHWGYWIPKPRKKNGEYRHWRQRKEYYGEMEQFDGSYHRWFEDRGPECCLLASIDDATGKITKLRFVYDEGVIPVFTFWKNYIEKHGKPLKIYLDRLSTYKNTHKSVLDDPDVLTQFQRAMRDLGIKLISAYSPQAKGRIERLFGILQDRLVKELRLAGISTIEKANKFAEEVFIPKHNAQFSVLAQKKRNLHKSLTKFEKENLDKIFSIQKTRVVNNDFTIRYEGKWFQLAETQPTLVLRKARVLVEERINGEIFISLRGKYLNYEVLPARPEKVKMKIIGLSRTKPAWKPPANHPWRKIPIINPKKRYQTSSLT
jgi:hypothetical protein